MNGQTIEIKGILAQISPTQKFGDLFTRKFWISENPNTNRNPVILQLELWHDDTEQLLGMKVGDPVQCKLILWGKKVTKKGTAETMVINTLLCRLVEKISPSQL